MGARKKRAGRAGGLACVRGGGGGGCGVDTPSRRVAVVKDSKGPVGLLYVTLKGLEN